MIKKLLCLLIFSLVIGCSKEASNTIEQALDKANIKYDSILKTLDKTNELVVLIYTNDNNLNIGLLDHKNNNWSWVTGQNSKIKKDIDIDWSYTNMDDSNPMFIGAVNNDKIKKIVIQTKKIQKKATIQQTDKLTYFYLLLDNPQTPPMRITGYDINGDVIYDSGPLD